MLGDVTLSPWASLCRCLDVDALCDADLPGGLRSIPDYIYEAAEVDRASKWVVLVDHVAMALPFIMSRCCSMRHENFKMFDMGQPAHRGWAGLDHRSRLDHAQARGVRELADRYSSAFAIILS